MPETPGSISLDQNKTYALSFKVENGVVVGQLTGRTDNAGVLIKKLPELLEIKIGDQIVKIDPATNSFKFELPKGLEGKLPIDISINKTSLGGMIIDPKAETVVRNIGGYKPLSVSETRILANNSKADLTKAREVAAKLNTPITDLHTHWPGVPTVDDLIKVGLDHKLGYPVDALAQMGVTAEMLKEKGISTFVEKGVTKVILNDLQAKMPDAIEKLKSNLSIKVDQQATFTDMEKIYEWRDPFVKDIKLLPDLLKLAAEHYQEKGVKYVEFSLNKILDPAWHKVISEQAPAIEKATGVKMGFLAGWTRHQTTDWYQAKLNVFEKMVDSPYLTGVDFIGYETNSTASFKAELDKLGTLNKERQKAGKAGFTVRIHAGETVHHQENVRLALEWAEANPHVKVRIAHGIYGIDDKTLELAKKLSDRGQVIIEINADSNLALNNIDKAAQLPIERYQKAGVKFVLSSDSPGMYRTDPDQLRLALAYSGVDPEAFNAMQKQLEKTFIEQRAALVQAKEVLIAREIAQMQKAEPTLTTEDARKRLFEHNSDAALEAKAEAYLKEKRTAALEATKAKAQSKGIVVDMQPVVTGAAPVNFSSDALKDVTAGKKPIAVIGSIPENLTDTQRLEYSKIVAKYAETKGEGWDPRAIAAAYQMDLDLKADDVRRADQALADKLLKDPKSIAPEKMAEAKAALERVRADTNARVELKAAIKVMVQNIDPSKAYFVTSGSDYGIQKIIHEEVAAHNKGLPPEKQIKVIATVAAKSPAPTIAEGVSHAVIVGDKYFDLPSRVIPEIVRNNGIIIAAGGNEIDSNKIVTAVNLLDASPENKTSITLVKKVGGVVESKAEFMEDRKLAVENSKELLQKMMKQNPDLFAAGFDKTMSTQMLDAVNATLAKESGRIKSLTELSGVTVEGKVISFNGQPILEKVGSSATFKPAGDGKAFEAFLKQSPEAAIIVFQNEKGEFQKATAEIAGDVVLKNVADIAKGEQLKQGTVEQAAKELGETAGRKMADIAKGFEKGTTPITSVLEINGVTLKDNVISFKGQPILERTGSDTAFKVVGDGKALQAFLAQSPEAANFMLRNADGAFDKSAADMAAEIAKGEKGKTGPLRAAMGSVEVEAKPGSREWAAQQFIEANRILGSKAPVEQLRAEFGRVWETGEQMMRGYHDTAHFLDIAGEGKVTTPERAVRFLSGMNHDVAYVGVDAKGGDRSGFTKEVGERLKSKYIDVAPDGSITLKPAASLPTDPLFQEAVKLFSSDKMPLVDANGKVVPGAKLNATAGQNEFLSALYALEQGKALGLPDKVIIDQISHIQGTVPFDKPSHFAELQTKLIETYSKLPEFKGATPDVIKAAAEKTIRSTVDMANADVMSFSKNTPEKFIAETTRLMYENVAGGPDMLDRPASMLAALVGPEGFLERGIPAFKLEGMVEKSAKGIATIYHAEPGASPERLAEIARMEAAGVKNIRIMGEYLRANQAAAGLATALARADGKTGELSLGEMLNRNYDLKPGSKGALTPEGVAALEVSKNGGLVTDPMAAYLLETLGSEGIEKLSKLIKETGVLPDAKSGKLGVDSPEAAKKFLDEVKTKVFGGNEEAFKPVRTQLEAALKAAPIKTVSPEDLVNRNAEKAKTFAKDALEAMERGRRNRLKMPVEEAQTKTGPLRASMSPAELDITQNKIRLYNEAVTSLNAVDNALAGRSVKADVFQKHSSEQLLEVKNKPKKAWELYQEVAKLTSELNIEQQIAKVKSGEIKPVIKNGKEYVPMNMAVSMGGEVYNVQVDVSVSNPNEMQVQLGKYKVENGEMILERTQERPVEITIDPATKQLSIDATKNYTPEERAAKFGAADYELKLTENRSTPYDMHMRVVQDIFNNKNPKVADIPGKMIVAGTGTGKTPMILGYAAAEGRGIIATPASLATDMLKDAKRYFSDPILLTDEQLPKTAQELKTLLEKNKAVVMTHEQLQKLAPLLDQKTPIFIDEVHELTIDLKTRQPSAERTKQLAEMAGKNNLIGLTATPTPQLYDVFGDAAAKVTSFEMQNQDKLARIVRPIDETVGKKGESNSEAVKRRALAQMLGRVEVLQSKDTSYTSPESIKTAAMTPLEAKEAAFKENIRRANDFQGMAFFNDEALGKDFAETLKQIREGTYPDIEALQKEIGQARLETLNKARAEAGLPALTEAPPVDLRQEMGKAQQLSLETNLRIDTIAALADNPKIERELRMAVAIDGSNLERYIEKMAKEGKLPPKQEALERIEKMRAQGVPDAYVDSLKKVTEQVYAAKDGQQAKAFSSAAVGEAKVAAGKLEPVLYLAENATPTQIETAKMLINKGIANKIVSNGPLGTGFSNELVMGVTQVISNSSGSPDMDQQIQGRSHRSNGHLAFNTTVLDANVDPKTRMTATQIYSAECVDHYMESTKAWREANAAAPGEKPVTGPLRASRTQEQPAPKAAGKPLTSVTPEFAAELNGVKYHAGTNLLDIQRTIQGLTVDKSVPLRVGITGEVLKAPTLTANSYKRFDGTHFASLSMPAETPEAVRWAALENFNSYLKANGIDTRSQKLGFDERSNTYYVEAVVDPAQFDKAQEILKNLTTKKDMGMTPVELEAAKRTTRPVAVAKTVDETARYLAAMDQMNIEEATRLTSDPTKLSERVSTFATAEKAATVKAQTAATPAEKPKTGPSMRPIEEQLAQQRTKFLGTHEFTVVPAKGGPMVATNNLNSCVAVEIIGAKNKVVAHVSPEMLDSKSMAELIRIANDGNPSGEVKISLVGTDVNKANGGASERKLREAIAAGAKETGVKVNYDKLDFSQSANKKGSGAFVSSDKPVSPDSLEFPRIERTYAETLFNSQQYGYDKVPLIPHDVPGVSVTGDGEKFFESVQKQVKGIAAPKAGDQPEKAAEQPKAPQKRAAPGVDTDLEDLLRYAQEEAGEKPAAPKKPSAGPEAPKKPVVDTDLDDLLRYAQEEVEAANKKPKGKTGPLRAMRSNDEPIKPMSLEEEFKEKARLVEVAKAGNTVFEGDVAIGRQIDVREALRNANTKGLIFKAQGPEGEVVRLAGDSAKLQALKAKLEAMGIDSRVGVSSKAGNVEVLEVSAKDMKRFESVLPPDVKFTGIPDKVPETVKALKPPAAPAPGKTPPVHQYADLDTQQKFGVYQEQNTRPYQEDRVSVKPVPPMTEAQARELLARTTGALAQDTANHGSHGSTFTGAVVTKEGNIVTANLGDSPAAAIVYDPVTGKTEVVRLTVDHTPSTEFKQFSNAQGETWFESGGRVNRTLAVNRALGDIDVGPGVSKTPDVTTHDLAKYRADGKKVFLLVASDGALKENKGITIEAHAETLAKALRENPNVPLEVVAKQIVANSLRSGDNVSAALVEVKPGNGAAVAIFDGHGGAQTAQTAVEEFNRITDNVQQKGVDKAFEHRKTTPPAPGLTPEETAKLKAAEPVKATPPVAEKPVESLKEVIGKKSAAGDVVEFKTNKGVGIGFTGTDAELNALKEKLAAAPKPITTSEAYVEVDGKPKRVLRVATADTAAVRDMLPEGAKPVMHSDIIMKPVPVVAAPKPPAPVLPFADAMRQIAESGNILKGPDNFRGDNANDSVRFVAEKAQLEVLKAELDKAGIKSKIRESGGIGREVLIVDGVDEIAKLQKILPKEVKLDVSKLSTNLPEVARVTAGVDKLTTPATPGEAARNLVALRDMISKLPVKEGFVQPVPFRDAAHTKPTLVENSYTMNNDTRHLVSINFPNIVPNNVERALQNNIIEYLKAQGIDATQVKFGFDRYSQTNYVEFDVTGPEYEKAKKLVNDLITKGESGLSPEVANKPIKYGPPEKTPIEVLKETLIKKGNAFEIVEFPTTKGIGLGFGGTDAELANLKEMLAKNNPSIKAVEATVDIGGGKTKNILRVATADIPEVKKLIPKGLPQPIFYDTVRDTPAPKPVEPVLAPKTEKTPVDLVQEALKQRATAGEVIAFSTNKGVGIGFTGTDAELNALKEKLAAAPKPIATSEAYIEVDGKPKRVLRVATADTETVRDLLPADVKMDFQKDIVMKPVPKVAQPVPEPVAKTPAELAKEAVGQRLAAGDVVEFTTNKGLGIGFTGTDAELNALKEKLAAAPKPIATSEAYIEVDGKPKRVLRVATADGAAVREMLPAGAKPVFQPDIIMQPVPKAVEPKTPPEAVRPIEEQLEKQRKSAAAEINLDELLTKKAKNGELVRPITNKGNGYAIEVAPTEVKAVQDALAKRGVAPTNTAVETANGKTFIRIKTAGIDAFEKALPPAVKSSELTVVAMKLQGDLRAYVTPEKAPGGSVVAEAPPPANPGKFADIKASIGADALYYDPITKEITSGQMAGKGAIPVSELTPEKIGTRLNATELTEARAKVDKTAKLLNVTNPYAEPVSQDRAKAVVEKALSYLPSEGKHSELIKAALSNPDLKIVVVPEANVNGYHTDQLTEANRGRVLKGNIEGFSGPINGQQVIYIPENASPERVAAILGEELRHNGMGKIFNRGENFSQTPFQQTQREITTSNGKTTTITEGDGSSRNKLYFDLIGDAMAKLQAGAPAGDKTPAIELFKKQLGMQGYAKSEIYAETLVKIDQLVAAGKWTPELEKNFGELRRFAEDVVARDAAEYNKNPAAYDKGDMRLPEIDIEKFKKGAPATEYRVPFDVEKAAAKILREAPNTPKPGGSVEPAKFDLTMPASLMPEEFVVKNDKGKPMTIEEYVKAAKANKVVMKEGIYYSPEGKAYAPVRHPTDSSLDRIIEVPPQELTKEFKQKIAETNAQLKGGKYSGTIDTLHSANRPLNWALMLTGGKSVIDSYHSGQLETYEGARGAFMFGSGLAGEIGSFTMLERSESQLAKMSKLGRGATNTVNVTGKVLRGTSMVAAPLILEDAAHDFIHAFAKYEKKDPEEKGITPEEKKKRQEHNAVIARQEREDASGGYFFGAMNARQHEFMKGSMKAVAGAEGTYMAVKTGIQSTRYLLANKAQKEVFKQAAKLAAMKAGGSALGMVVPGVNLIMAVDMACDLAVDAAERHAEQGLQIMNQGVGIRNNMKANLTRHTEGTQKKWNEVYDYDIGARRADYQAELGNDASSGYMDSYINLVAKKQIILERIAANNKEIAEATDPKAKAAYDASNAELMKTLGLVTSTIEKAGPEIRAEMEKEAIERINADKSIPADKKAEFIDYAKKNLDTKFSPENVTKLTGLKRRVMNAEALNQSNAVALGTRERTIELMRQFPNIYVPLEKAGLLSGPNALPDDVLAAKTSYKDFDGKDVVYTSTFALEGKIEAKQRALGEEIDALHEEIFKMEGLGSRLGTARTGNAMPVDLGYLGYSTVAAAAGHEYGNTAGVDPGSVNSILEFVIHGQKDNSYSTQLARLENYKKELETSNGGFHPTDSSAQGKALVKVNQMMEKIRLIYQLEDAKKSVAEKPEKVVIHEEVGPDKKVVKTRAPSYAMLMNMDRNATKARDGFQADKAARVEGQYERVMKSLEPHDIAKDLDASLNAGEKIVTGKLFLTKPGELSYYSGNTPEEKTLGVIASSGVIKTETITAAKEKLAKEIAAVKAEVRKDPELLKIEAELTALNAETAGLKKSVPDLVDRLALQGAGDKEKALKAQLDELNKIKLPHGNENFLDSQKKALNLKIESIQKQISSKKVTDPELRAEAMDMALNTKTMKSLDAREAELIKTIKAIEDDKTRIDGNLWKLKEEVADLQKFTQSDVAKDIRKLQDTLAKKAEFEQKLMETNAKLYVKVQEKIIGLNDKATEELSVTLRKEIGEYQKTSNDLVAKVSDESIPALTAEQKKEAQKLLDAVNKAKVDEAKVVAEKDPKNEYPVEVSMRLHVVKTQRAYYDYLAKTAEENKAAGLPVPAKDSPEAVLRRAVAFENNSFNEWASDAMRSATTENGRKAIAELIVLRQEMLEARTDAMLAGQNKGNPLDRSMNNFQIQQRAAAAIEKLSPNERERLEEVNKAFDVTRDKVSPVTDKIELQYRNLDKLVRGSSDQLKLARAVESKIFIKSDYSKEWRDAAVYPVKKEDWSPENEIFTREMVRQLEMYGRNVDADTLRKSAKENWNVDLDRPADMSASIQRMEAEGLVSVPQQLGNDKVIKSKAVSEADAIDLFAERLKDHGEKHAFEFLKSLSNGKYIDSNNELTPAGKKFFERAAQINGEESLKTRPMSAEAKKLLDDWRAKKKVEIPEYSEKNRALVIEIIQELELSGETNNEGTKSVSFVKDAIKYKDGWSDKAIVGTDNLLRSGNADFALKRIQAELKELATKKRDPETETAGSFEVDKYKEAKATKAYLSETLKKMKLVRESAASKGIKVTPLSAESEKLIDELQQKSAELVLDGARLTIEGKAIANSSVEEVKRKHETDDRYKQKNPEEAGISPEEKQARIKHNDEIREEMKYELQNATERDLETVAQSTVDASWEIQEILEKHEGKPIVLSDEQKETLRQLAANQLARENKDSNYKNLSTKDTDKFSAAVEKATGYKIPVADLKTAFVAKSEKQAQDMLEEWRQKREAVLPYASARNAALVLEVVRDQQKAGATKAVDHILKKLREDPQWKREGIVSKEYLLKTGNADIQLEFLNQELKEIAERKPPQLPPEEGQLTEQEFAASLLEDSNRLRAEVDETVQALEKINKERAAEGLPPIQLSEENQKKLEELQQKSLDLVIASSKDVMDGKTLTDSQVLSYSQKHASEEYYQPKKLDEPGLTAEQIAERIKENAAIEKNKAGDMEYAKQIDGETVKKNTSSKAYDVMAMFERHQGKPMVLNEQQKLTIRKLAAAMLEGSRPGEEVSVENLDQFKKAVEKATGYKLPTDDIVGDFKKKNPKVVVAASTAPSTAASTAPSTAPAVAPETSSAAPSSPAVSSAPAVSAAPAAPLVTTDATATAPLDDKMAKALAQAKDAAGVKVDKLVVPTKQRDAGLQV